MKKYAFPIGKLTPDNRLIALLRIKATYPDATSDFTSPFRISVTLEDMKDEGDAEFEFGLLVGGVIADLSKYNNPI